MKRLCTIMTILILSSLAAAGQSSLHIKYGVEWGYDATFMDKYHFIYFDPDVGYRIDSEGTKLFLYSNGYISARAGVEFWKHYSATILAGYCGVKQGRGIFPFTLRGTYFMDSYDTDGIMAFCEGGLGVHPGTDGNIYIGKMGAGYRLKMSKKSSLDFMVSVQMVKDHPEIYISEIPGYIPDYFVRVSDDLFASFNLSCAICF